MNSLYEQFLVALHAVWHRRWLALAVAWGVALVGWLIVALVPNSYESSARVYVSMQSILPTQVGITPADQQKAIDRVRDTLTSATNLEKVIRRTDLGLQATNDADVAEMVDAWDRARRLREFLDEYDRRMGERERGDVPAAWTQMARGLAESLDPMNRLTEIAKVLEPTDEVLAQFVEDA